LGYSVDACQRNIYACGIVRHCQIKAAVDPCVTVNPADAIWWNLFATKCRHTYIWEQCYSQTDRQRDRYAAKQDRCVQYKNK